MPPEGAAAVGADTRGAMRHPEAKARPRLSPAARPGYHRGRRPANAGKTYPAEILTAEEANALLAACSASSSSGLRNRALITLLYRAGLRLSEALALYPKDFDSAGAIAVLHGKGDRRRTAAIDPTAVEIIDAWLKRRTERGLDGRRHLICTLAGRPLRPSYVRTLLPRLASRAGIDKRVHPHGLRHTHAAELALEGLPMNLIQQQLGHASLATTDRYLRHIAPAELLWAITARSWRPPA